MALISLLSALLLGAAIVRRIPFALYKFEAAALSVVLGLFTWTWLVFLAVLVLAYDIAIPLVIMASLVAVVGLWPGGRFNWQPLEGGRRAWTVWGVATALTGAVITRLFWTHSLPKDATGIYSAGASWADYGVHASIISHISSVSHLPTDLPVAAGEKLTYPFLIDLLSAMYVQGGMSLSASLFWPGLLLALAICQLLISVGLRLFGRISVGVGGLGLALTIGSAAGAWTAWDAWRDSGKGLFAFLKELPSDFTGIADSNANVTNLLVDAILPQRSILFGLGVGLTALIFLITAREREDKKLLWPAAVLIGLLPMAHPHTFMVGVGWFAMLAAEAAWRKRAVPVAFLQPLGLLLLLAIPQIAWQQLANDHGTGGRFRFGWMVQDGHSVFGYWWANFGLMGLAFIAIPIIMRRHRQVIWFLPMLIVLLITQIYAFQPFEYDNLKLIYWVYIFAGFFISYLVAELVRRHRAWLALVVPVGFLVVVPGVLAITHEFQLKYQFASPDDIALAEWAGKNTPPDAVFLSTDRPTFSVATLAGRPMVLGYRGWLYNFSVPYQDREAAVRAGLAGNFGDPAIARYGVKYLAVATSEDSSWQVDNAALSRQPVVYSNPTWRVFQVPSGFTQPAATTAAPAAATAQPAATTPAATAPAATTP